MENSTTFHIIGHTPDFIESSQIIIEDEIRLNSIIYFQKRENGITAIKLVDLNKLENFNELVYRAGHGSEPGQIVLEQIDLNTLKETIETQNYLNALLTQTFDNLAFFYRDQNLSDDLTNKYYRGLIIQERGFVDASLHPGGLAAKHRFLIASTQGKNLSVLPGVDPAQGLIVIMSESFFKVLDVAEKEGRKQITLLHIPEELIDFFSAGEELSSVEKEVVVVARSDFEQNFSAPPVDALLRPEWINRMSTPIGISDEGEYFYQPGQNR